MTNSSNPEGKPALTINFQSWATPILGLVMLVVGLVAGYFVHPLLTSSAKETSVAQAPATTAPTVASAQASQQPAATSETSQIQSAQQLMDYLLSKTIHFEGDANAPVTIIEFSDFQ